MRLHTSEVRLWLGLHVNPRIKLYACASTIRINGKQTISDTVFSQADFSNLHKKGYCGGVRYDLGDAGYIGLEGSGRHRRGGAYFLVGIFEYRYRQSLRVASALDATRKQHLKGDTQLDVVRADTADRVTLHGEINQPRANRHTDKITRL